MENQNNVHYIVNCSCVFSFQRLVCLSLRPGFSQIKPSLAVYEFDPSWQLCQKQIHHIEGLNYGHDFVLLPDYYVFHMTPFVKRSWWITTKILMGWTSPGEEMKYYPDLPSRFVIIPRHMSDGNAGVMFVDTDPCHVRFNIQISKSHFCLNHLQQNVKMGPHIFGPLCFFISNWILL